MTLLSTPCILCPVCTDLLVCIDKDKRIAVLKHSRSRNTARCKFFNIRFVVPSSDVQETNIEAHIQ
jgi:hypothetical protein